MWWPFRCPFKKGAISGSHSEGWCPKCNWEFKDCWIEKEDGPLWEEYLATILPSYVFDILWSRLVFRPEAYQGYNNPFTRSGLHTVGITVRYEVSDNKWYFILFFILCFVVHRSSTVHTVGIILCVWDTKCLPLTGFRRYHVVKNQLSMLRIGVSGYKSLLQKGFNIVFKLKLIRFIDK